MFKNSHHLSFIIHPLWDWTIKSSKESMILQNFSKYEILLFISSSCFGFTSATDSMRSNLKQISFLDDSWKISKLLWQVYLKENELHELASYSMYPMICCLHSHWQFQSCSIANRFSTCLLTLLLTFFNFESSLMSQMTFLLTFNMP